MPTITTTNPVPLSRSFDATLLPAGRSTMAAIEVPFDPKAVFGLVRAPVVVTIGTYSYRSTICRMEGQTFVPLRRAHREAAGLTMSRTVRVTLTQDNAPRTVAAPADLKKALRAASLLDAFESLSYTHQREHVEAIESAKRDETRARRIEGCIKMLAQRSRKIAAPRAPRGPVTNAPAPRRSRAAQSGSKPAKRSPRPR